MQDALIKPLHDITYAADVLLLQTELSDAQRGFLQSAYDASRTMLEMVVSFPAVDSQYASELYSYEASSHLASIIGYTEMLLDEDDGVLSEKQRQHLRQIHAAGKQIVRDLPEPIP